MKGNLLILVGLLAANTAAQEMDTTTVIPTDTVITTETYNDAAVVREILKKCGFTDADCKKNVVMEQGRVVSLDLSNTDISKDGLSEIPSEIGELTALREFSCRENSVVVLPPEIGQLRSLEKLDLASNRIVSLPIQIAHLEKLTHLDLRHNRMETLFPQIDYLKNLRYLQLWGNRLTVLDKNVTHLVLLRELYLKDNRLTTLPDAIVRMNLTYVDLYGNRFCDLNPALDAWAKKADKRYKQYQKCW